MTNYINTNNKYKQQVDDLRKRAAIRREATGRKSVEEGEIDRLAKQLDDAADTIEELAGVVFNGNTSGFQPLVAGSNPVARSKLTKCTDCGRMKECNLAISVGQKDGELTYADPAWVCVEFDDCIKHCGI